MKTTANPGWFKAKLHPGEEAEICRRYTAGELTTALGREYGVHTQSVCNILQRHGIPRRTQHECRMKYPFNEQVFRDVTEESAYWIGFIMADGNVRIANDGSHCLTIGLSRRDHGHLEKFCSFVGTDKKPRLAPENTSIIELFSKEVYADLGRYGVVPRKSLVAQVIGLEDNRHFWRGYVDGNGCVHWCKRGYPVLQLVSGSKRLMFQYKEYSESVIPSSRSVPHGKANCWKVTFETVPALLMLHHLYDDCTIALDRKLARAREYTRRYEKTLTERAALCTTGP